MSNIDKYRTAHLKLESIAAARNHLGSEVDELVVVSAAAGCTAKSNMLRSAGGQARLNFS